MRISTVLRSVRRPLQRSLLLLLATGAGLQAQTFGEALVTRNLIDSFRNFLSISGTAFAPATYGQAVNSFSVLGGATLGGDNNIGRSITPVLVTAPVGGTFNILAIGATRTISSGINTWDFGTVSGTNAAGANVLFGWISSGDAGGTVHYTPDTGPTAFYTSINSMLTLPSAGQSFSLEGSATRSYSIQWTVGSPTVPPTPGVVPEPSSYLLLASGLGALALVSRRRERTRRG